MNAKGAVRVVEVPVETSLSPGMSARDLSSASALAKVALERAARCGDSPEDVFEGLLDAGVNGELATQVVLAVREALICVHDAMERGDEFLETDDLERYLVTRQVTPEMAKTIAATLESLTDEQ